LFSWRKWLNRGGAILGVASLVFVLMRLNKYAGQIDFSSFNAAVWTKVILLAASYGLANTLLGLAWLHILSFLQITTSRGWALRTYGVSQLAKYVPGNIFQFAGRQALGLAAGMPGWALAKSAVWELGLVALSGALIASMALPLLWPLVSLGFALLVFLTILSLFEISARYWLGPSMALAMICQVLFLMISGLVFVGTLSLVTDGNALEIELLLPFMSGYVVAWLAGFLTPGAPAGIGVRELVLLVLFGARVHEANLLLAVVLNRMITSAGDLTFFAWASVVSSKLNR